MASRKKVAIGGAGNVGATVAHWAMAKELADIVLVDVEAMAGKTAGKALDLAEAAPVAMVDINVTGTSDYEATRGSDVVVITAGVPRRPGMSREDLIGTNAKIVTDVTNDIVSRSPEAILIYVTNPLDAIVYLGYKVSGFPKNRVMGQAGVLDTARYRTFIGKEAGVSVRDIQAMVLGGHGDDMVPLTRYTSVGGIPVSEFISEDKIKKIVERTRQGGGEIVKLLGDGSAYYAPGAATVEMIAAIVGDQKRVLPVTAYLEGEYGLSGMFMGVPAVIGASGVERIVQVQLDAREQEMLGKSVASVRGTLEIVNKMGL